VSTTSRAQSRTTSPGELFQVIRAAGPLTRRELIDRSGLGRSTVAQRVDALIASSLIEQVGEGPSTGGRPPGHLVFNPRAGIVLAADLGVTHSQLAVADLAGVPLVELRDDIEIGRGPGPVLEWVEQGFDRLLAEAEISADRVRAIGIGVPGPVEFATGRPVNPPIMPGWDAYPVADHLTELHGVPTLVDNDVNLMALGEHWHRWPSCEDLLFVKVGTGIGCGIISGGSIYRGAQGAAGDIGHIRVAGYDDVVCHCGNVGCLEAVAGGGALAAQLHNLGFDTRNSRDVVALVRAHNADAVRLVRHSGRLLGEILAHLVNALNPAVIVIGGDIAHAHEQLFAGVREVVYQRSTPLATRHLHITRSPGDDHVGVMGAAAMAVDHILSAEVVDRELLNGIGPGQGSLPAAS
jgi:predicted NBD/HSP70 family sugar kinase